ncbi:MAG: hypothetical protein KME11_17125 [Timaviella obliquedivisa GSE-PSE-MK23-08B]|nr:hypothetical protein [Timaviella obliquedivisa GSE-PSE-MK23-08B]
MVKASIVAALSFWLVGCSENRSSQCVKLIGVANQAVNSIEAVTAPSSADSIEALRKIAVVAEDTNKAMRDLSLTDGKLIEFRDRFTAMYEATSAATQSLIQSSSIKDTAASQKAYEDLKASTSQESPLVDEVNQYCNAGQ